ncbi:MAG: hypothetical protein QM723_14815 [Myxococcaceae bacterium]
MRTLLIVSFAVLAACANPQPAAAVSEPKPAPAPVVASGGPKTPLSVSWSEKQLSAHSAVVEARVQYNGPFDMPLHLAVQVPAGAALAKGEVTLDVPAQPTATTVVNVYEVTFEQVPAGDLVLVADAQSPVTGVHATSTYRFGRAAPAAQVPQANGPDVKLNGLDLGHAVPLAPAKK